MPPDIPPGIPSGIYKKFIREPLLISLCIPSEKKFIQSIFCVICFRNVFRNSFKNHLGISAEILTNMYFETVPGTNDSKISPGIPAEIARGIILESFDKRIQMNPYRIIQSNLWKNSSTSFWRSLDEIPENFQKKFLDAIFCNNSWSDLWSNSWRNSWGETPGVLWEILREILEICSGKAWGNSEGNKRRISLGFPKKHSAAIYAEMVDNGWWEIVEDGSLEDFLNKSLEELSRGGDPLENLLE